jgi:hypothetical protein
LGGWLALALVLGLGGLALLLGVGWHMVFEGHRRIGLSVASSTGSVDDTLLFDIALMLLGSLAAAWGWLIARNVEWVRARQAARARTSIAS